MMDKEPNILNYKSETIEKVKEEESQISDNQIKHLYEFLGKLIEIHRPVVLKQSEGYQKQVNTTC